MRKYTIKIGMLVLGWSLLVLGVIGLVVPFLQGIIFIVLGVLVLSRHSLWFERQITRIKERYPGFAAVMDRVESKIGEWTRSDARAMRGNPGRVEKGQRPPDDDLPTIR